MQGTLDPIALTAPAEVLDRMVREVLDDAGPAPGHVFNLGHGIQPDASIDSVLRLVDSVHDLTRRVPSR